MNWLKIEGKLQKNLLEMKVLKSKVSLEKEKNENPIIRRCKKRIQGTEFSFPTETNNVLRQIIKLMMGSITWAFQYYQIM